MRNTKQKEFEQDGSGSIGYTLIFWLLFIYLVYGASTDGVYLPESYNRGGSSRYVTGKDAWLLVISFTLVWTGLMMRYKTWCSNLNGGDILGGILFGLGVLAAMAL